MFYPCLSLPFSPPTPVGLYVGAYGPYTSEAIQVRRRFGTWEEPEGEEEESDVGEAGEGTGRRKRQGERALVPPFEYVEGVKLTGDFNVPAGKVSSAWPYSCWDGDFDCTARFIWLLLAWKGTGISLQNVVRG
ncbi:unnamed protein product [Closterium sp. NIES-54]